MAKIGSITDKAKDQAKKRKPGTTIDSLLGGKKQGSGLLSGGKKQSSGNKQQGSGLLSGGAQTQPNDAYQAAIAKLMGGINNGITTGLNQIPKPNIQTPQPMGYTQPQGIKQPGGMPNYAEMLANRSMGGGQTKGIQLPGTQNLQGIVPAAQTGGSADYVRRVLGMSSNINRPQQPANRMQTVQAQGITAPSMQTTSNNYAGNVAGNGKQPEEVKPVAPVAGAPEGNTAPMYNGPLPEEVREQQNAADNSSAMKDYIREYGPNSKEEEYRRRMQAVGWNRAVKAANDTDWKPVDISLQDEFRKREANAIGVPKELLPYARENYGQQKAAETYKDRMNAASKSLDYDEYIKTMAEGVKYGAWDERDEVALKSDERLKEEIASYDNRIAYQDTIDYSDEALERREKDIEKLEMIGTGWGTLYNGTLEDGTMLQRLGYHQYGKPEDYHSGAQYKYNGEYIPAEEYYDYVAYDMTHVRTVAELNKEYEELTMKAAADPDNKVVQARLKEVEKELGRVRTEASEIWAGLYIGDQAFWDKRVREEKEAQRQADILKEQMNPELPGILRNERALHERMLQYREMLNDPNQVKEFDFSKLPARERVKSKNGGDFIRVHGTDADTAYYYANVPYEFIYQENHGYKIGVDENGNWYSNNPNPDRLPENLHPSDARTSTYMFMTEDEKKIFNSLYLNGEKGEAEYFLDLISDSLARRKAEYNDNAARWMVDNSPMGWAEGVGTVFTQPVASFLGSLQAAGARLGIEGSGDKYSPMMWGLRHNESIRDEVGANWDKWAEERGMKGWGKFFSGVAFSIADNLVALAIGKGYTIDAATQAQAMQQATALVQVVMSMGAAGNKFLQQLNAGVDPKLAASRAFTSGVVEAVTERYSIEHYLNPSNKDIMVAYLAKSFFAEGSEEVAADWLYAVSDEIVSRMHKQRSELMTKFDQLKGKYGEDKAWKMVFTDFMEQNIESFLAGGISGLGMGGATYITNRIASASEGNMIAQADDQNIQNLLMASQWQYGDARIMGRELQRRMGKKNVSMGELSVLARTMIENGNNEVRQVVNRNYENIIRDKLTYEGVAESDANDMSKIIAKASEFGIESLSKKERARIQDNQAAYDTMTEIVEDNSKAALLKTVAQIKSEQETKQTRDAMYIAEEALKGNKTSDSLQEVTTRETDTKEVRERAQQMMATEEDIESAAKTGNRIGNAAEVVLKDVDNTSRFAEIQEIKGDNVYVSVDGVRSETPVKLADIKPTNTEVAKLIAETRQRKGFINDGFMSEAIRKAAAQGENINERYAQDVMQIYRDALTEDKLHNTSLDGALAENLYNIAKKELNEHSVNKNVTQITPGKGKARIGDAEYGSREWNEKVKELPSSIARKYADGIGIMCQVQGWNNVVIDYDTTREDQNGYYKDKDGNIHVNLAAREESGNTHNAFDTLAHEMIHWLASTDFDMYKQLRTDAYQRMRKAGVDIWARIVAQYDMNGRSSAEAQEKGMAGYSMLSAIDASEEVVAQAFSRVFASEEYVNSLKANNKNLYGKIKSFVLDFIQKFRNYFKANWESQSYESKRLYSQMEDMAKVWLGAMDVAKNNIAIQKENEQNQQAFKPADQYTAEQTEAARDIVREAMEHPVTHFSINTKNPGVQVQVIKNGLMAVHNLSERSFLSVLEMLGFPMPSIAVIGDQAFTGYGDISVFFGENAVRFAEGSVYNGDAMTPTLGNNRVRSTNEAMDVLHQQPKRGLSGRSDMVQLFTDYIEVASKEAARRKAYQTTEERQQIKEQADALQSEIFDAAKRISTQKYGSDLNNRQLTQSIGMGILTAAEIMQREQNLTNEDRMQILQDNMDLMLEHAQGVDLTAEDFTTEQYEQMLEFIDVASQLSSGWRMMESKPDTVLDFKNDLKAVLMPDDTPTKIIQQAIDAGIAKEKIFFYPHNNMKARKAAMMELPNVAEGVRFSKRMQDNENVVRTDREAINRDLMDSLENGQTQYGEYRRFSKRVTDKDELEMLDGQETVKTYKTMQLIDGKLYPPMAAVVAGSMEDASKLGEWEKATEHPELIKNGNKFTLNKGKGKGSLQAAYNPYMHSSNLMINDQFSGAWNRNNLVTVECEVPASELDSGYHAEFAKDTTGWHSWHTGTVAGQLRKAKGTERQVMLSRWIRPMRIVPDSEVAQHYKELLDGTKIKVPDNVVTPSLLEELKKAGVPIRVTGKVQTGEIDIEVKPKSKTEETGEKGINGPATSKYKNMTLGNDISEEGTSEDTTSTKKPKARYVDEENNVRNSFRDAAKETGLKVTDSGEIQDRNGKPIANILPGGTLVKHSLRSWGEEDIIKLKKTAIKAGFSEKKVNKWIKDIDSIGSIIAQDKGRLDFIPDRDQKFKKANGDVYKWTLDASTLCAKRLLYQGTFNEIQKHLADIPLLPEDLIDLANMMHEMGYQTPCGICYVESRRRHLGEFTKEFLDNYQGEYKPTYADLTSTEGLANLKRTHRQAYDDYMKAMNGKGVSSPKVVQLRTDYRGDVRDLNAQSIKALNEIGGLRINSFSDFETPHLMDMMQAVLDMSIAGLKSQAYTKVPNFAWAFGNTGIKINLSLMGDGTGVDENGNLIFSDTEGMKFDEAMKLRETYSKNVGTILVGMNDNHIIAAMGDPRIDYIIPFHKSGWSANELAKMKTLESYDDYTDSQNEKWITGVKKGGGYQTASIDKKIGNLDPYGENGYWNYNKDGEYNARKYLELCAKQKRLPKFSQFLVDHGDGTFTLPEGTDQRSENIRKGYWKTLIDFKMYDNNGKGAKQQKVQFDVNMEQAYRILDEYEAPEGGNNALPVAQPVVDKYVNYIKEKKAAEVKGPATSAYGNMTLGNEIGEEENEEDYDSMPKPKARYADEENVRRSLRQQDEDYAKAVANNDMETAQRMVDEAAENAGYVKEGYHGTLNGGFTIFDKKKAHIGGNSGAGFYFSSNQDDSEANYSDVEGADNHFKVMHLVEKIQQYIEDTGENEYAGIPIPEDATDAELEDIAKKMIQGNPQTYHVRLNPGRVYIRDYGKSTNLLENVYDDFDENDYNRDDFDSDEQYEDAVFEGREEHLYQAISDAVYKAIRDVDSNFEIVSNVDYESIISELAMIAQDYDELTWKDVSKVISEQYIDALVDDGEESADATAEITRAIVEAFGFDSIEDREVGTKFNQLKNMSAGDTVHYIMFRPNQIKSVDPVTYDRNKKPIELSQRFNQGNNDIRYSKRIAEQDVRQSRRGPDMDINQWMMDLKPWQLRTASERQLLQNYKGLRTKIELQHERIEKTQRQIRELTIRENTPENKNMIERLKLKLQDQQKALDNLEEQWIEVTSDEGYAKMMKQWYDFAENMIQGKTQEQVAEAIYRMQDTAEAMQKRINETAEELRKLAKDEGVQRGRSIISNNSLNKAAADFRKQYHLDISKQELMDALSKIRLEIHAGEADAASEDVMALAGQIMEHMHGEPSQALKQLRGMTITLSPGQLKELTGSNRSLTELRRELARTGIKVKTATMEEIKSGKKTTLSNSWDELCDMLEGKLTRDVPAEQQVFELMRFIRGEMQAASQPQFDAKEADVINDVWDKALQLKMVTATDPAMQSKLDKMHEYIQQMSRAAEEGADIIDKINSMVGQVIKEGKRAAAYTDSMRQDIARTVEYFDKVARMAQDTARNDHLKEVIENLKSEAAQKLLRTNQEWRDLVERDRKARLQAEDNDVERNKMNTVVKRLAKLMSEPKNEKNIPEHMQGLARELMGILVGNDMSGGRRILQGPKKSLADLQRRLRAWNVRDGAFDINEMPIADDSEEKEMILNNLDTIRETIREWNGRYKGKNNLDTLEQMGKTLTKMQEAVSEIYSYIQAERYISEIDRKILVSDAAEMVQEGTKGKVHKELTGKLGGAINFMHRAIISGNMTPEYFFRTLDNEGISMLWDGYKEAENRNGLELKKAQDRLEEIAEKHGFKNWDMKQKHQLQLESGRTVTMTTGQLMSLYATWNREQTLGPEMSEHLAKGGFFAEEDTREGIIGKLVQQKRPSTVTPGDMVNVGNMLSDEQRAFVNDIVSYMSKDLSKLGNEASMMAYGMKLYKETYYFPFKMWDGIKSRKSNEAGKAAGANQAFHPSFSKSRMHGANNAIIIGDFMQTATDHIVGMINYATMGLANENLNKVLNYTVTEENGSEQIKRNIRAIFEEAYGKEAGKYLDDLKVQLNGGAVKANKDFYDNLISIFRKNAVAGSLSVALQQPLSYLRAGVVMNPKYLAQALGHEWWKGSYEELMKYSGVAVIKDMGKFDMNAGQGARNYITPDGQESKAKKAWDFITDKLTILPNKMDALTWTRMWVATKLEQKALHPDMDVKSEEFLKMAAKRFNDVMRRTQVYDSTLVRSANMRSDRQMVKGITSFMAEPTLTLNLLADGVRQIKQGKAGGKAALAKAGAAYLMSAVLQAVVKGFAGAGRNPDDDKTALENFLYRFGNSAISELDPLTMIPGYSDAITLMKDSELSDDAWGSLGKMFKAFKNAGGTIVNLVAGKGFKEPYREFEDSVAQIVQLFSNLPAKNLMRDARMMYNWFIDQPFATRPNSAAIIKYQAIDSFMNADNMVGVVNKWLGDAGYKTTKAAYKDRIKEAEAAGDTEAAEAMREYTGLTASDSEKNENRYMQEEMKAGRMTSNEVKAKLRELHPDRNEDSIWWTVDRMEYENATGKEVGTNKYYRLWDAMDNNKAEEIGNAIQSMQEHGVQAKSIKDQINGHYKELYLAADNRGKVEIRGAMEKAYKKLGYTAEDADKVINKWK